jgi:4-amino-4-deoxy-L-arabinose transferase-like glycosyltransferase
MPLTFLVEKLTARSALVLLLLLTLAVGGVCVLWVFTVPIYQAPDETVHLDYALAIRQRHGLFQVHGPLPHPIPMVHPYSRYLMDRAGHQPVIFHSEIRMPPGYGLPGFYEAIDRERPEAASCNVSEPPALAWVYPYGFYTLLAVWLEILFHLTDSLVAVFFGARLLSVLLLMLSLLLIYRTAREMHYGRGFSLMLICIIGFFPLTTFVGSYVQPDNLSFTLVSLCLYLTLLARRKLESRWVLGMLGLAFGALLATKQHYFVCAFVPALALLATERAVRGAGIKQWLRLAVMLGLPSVLLGCVHLWTVWDATTYYTATAGHDNLITFVLVGFKKAFRDFFTGTTHKSFWGIFGWLDTRLEFGNWVFTQIIRTGLVAGTLVLLVLILVRWKQITGRLFGLVRRGRGWLAWQLAVSNPVLNSLWLFAALMFFLHIRLDNRFGAQGRNWLPLIMPIFLAAIAYAPRALPRPRHRRLLSAGVLVSLTLYSLVGNYFALRSIRARYYDSNNDRPMVQKRVPVQSMVARLPPANEESAQDGASFLGTTLERPEFVYAVRFQYVVTNPSEEKVPLRVFWGNAAEHPPTAATRELVLDWANEPIEKTLFVWVNDQVDHLGMRLSCDSDGFELRQIVLYQEPDR